MLNHSRRGFLRMAGIAPLVPILATSRAQQSKSIKKRHLDNENPFSLEIPADVRDPLLVTIDGDQAYIQVEGFESVDRGTFTENVLRLDPEVFESAQLTELPVSKVNKFGHHHAEVGLFARRYGFPHSNGVHAWMPADSIYENWYQHLPEQERWVRPDGTPVTHPEELFAEDLDGNSREPVTSIFATGSRDRLEQNGIDIFELGINRFWIDAVAHGLEPGLDYSEWAQSAFREYLSTLDSSKREKLGITEPKDFDIREYLSEEGLTPHDEVLPIEDELFREYVLFQRETEREFVSTLFRNVREQRSEQLKKQGTTISGLGFGLQGHLLEPSAIYVVDDLDIVSIETQPTVPPNRPHDITTKIGRAAGRFDKPVVIGKGKMTTLFGYTFDLDPSEMYPTLMKIQAAMAYAHGGIRGIELPSLADHDYPSPDDLITWMDDDGSIPETLHGFADFIRAHREFLMTRETANNTVIAVSLPTLIWQYLPDWGIGITPHTHAISGAADVLRREQIPYDVVILDHPEVWKAPEQTERLSSYDLIVLPEVESITDDQVESIRGALEDDSTVIATGGGPSHDCMYNSREDIVSEIKAAENGVILDSNPETDPAAPGSEEFRGSLPDGSRQLSLSVDEDISINIVRDEEPQRIIVHLVNFTYDRDEDSTTTFTDIELSIRDLPFSPTSVTYHTQGDIESLSVQEDDMEYTTQIPRLDVWGFVVFSATEGTRENEYSEAEAIEALEQAESRVHEARENDRTEVLERAEAKLETLDPLVNYSAYDEVIRQTNAIDKWTNKAYQSPTIGINQAHEGPNLDFGRLQDIVGGYQYKTVTDWSDETLDPIDILIIAAGDEHDTVSFDFSQNEIEQIESFVKEGGSLLLLGRWSMDRTINNLSSIFGIEFSQYAVHEAEHHTRHRVRSLRSEFTDQIPKWNADFGVTLKETDNTTVLAWVDSEQDTWLVNEETHEQEKDDASGLPVMLATEYGEGTVLAMGHANQFAAPREPSPGLSSFVQNVFWKLGERATRQVVDDEAGSSTGDTTDDKEDDTTDDEEDDTTDDEEDDTTDENGSGFGVGAALTGLGGAAYLLKKRRLDNDQSE